VADLSDVTAYLASAANSAVYPNGISQPSVGNIDVSVFEGWPIGDQLDLDMQGKMKDPNDPTGGRIIARPGGPLVNVSIYPMQGTGRTVYQVLEETYTIVPVSYGLSVSIAGDIITVSGQPKSGEYLTVVADRGPIFSATGATTQALLATLAAQAQANYPSASSTANTLTIPFGYSLEVRQGGAATLGRVTHRQCHPVMITVWAPNRVARNAIAAAIDETIKQNNKITLPDTSQALVIYDRTMVSDQEQASNIYRRDLIYNVDYATLQTFPGYVVTSVTTTIDAVGNGDAISTAVT
jgi:hypothetical protein